MIYYLGQVSQIAVAIFAAPYYLKIFGIDGYGIIAICLLVIFWFQVLETGMSQSIAQVFATSGGGSDPIHVRTESITKFTVISTVVILTILVVLAVIGPYWLPSLFTTQYQKSIGDKFSYIALAIILAGCRLALSLPKSICYGSGSLSYIGTISTISSVLRFALTIVIFHAFSIGIYSFFISQICISFLELICFSIRSKRYISYKSAISHEVNWKFVSDFIYIAGGITGSALVWAVVTTGDRVWLAMKLSLAEFSIISLVTMIAGGIGAASSPIMMAFLPSFCKSYTSMSSFESHRLFLNISALYISCTVIIASPMIAIPYGVLVTWTGNSVVALNGEGPLAIYAMGFVVQALGGLVYFLQYASGNLANHLKGSLIFAVCYMICLPVFISELGLMGSGLCWLILNCLYLYTWSLYCIIKYEKNLAISVIIKFPIFLVILPLLFAKMVNVTLNQLTNQFFPFLNIGCAIFTVFLASFLLNKFFRFQIYELLTIIRRRLT